MFPKIRQSAIDERHIVILAYHAYGGKPRSWGVPRRICSWERYASVLAFPQFMSPFRQPLCQASKQTWMVLTKQTCKTKRWTRNGGASTAITGLAQLQVTPQLRGIATIRLPLSKISKRWIRNAIEIRAWQRGKCYNPIARMDTLRAYRPSLSSASLSFIASEAV